MIQKRNVYLTLPYSSPAPAGLFSKLLSRVRLCFYLTLLNNFSTNTLIVNKIRQTDIDFQLNTKAGLLNKNTTPHSCEQYQTSNIKHPISILNHCNRTANLNMLTFAPLFSIPPKPFIWNLVFFNLNFLIIRC